MSLFGPPDIEKLKANRNVNGLCKALTHRDPKVRMAAGRALGDLGDAQAVNSLATALQDKDKYFRLVIAEALGRIGDGKTVEPLIAALRDEDQDVRQTAAKLLGESGDAKAVDPLVTAFQDKDKFFRLVIADALGRIGGAKAVEPLIAALRDEDQDVRQTAAKLLGESGDAKAVDPLVAFLRDDNQRKNRQIAADALDLHGWHPGLDETGAWYWITRNNLDNCAPIGVAAVSPLMTFIKETADQEAELRAEKILEQMGSQIVDMLIPFLKDNDFSGWKVCSTAARLLGTFGDTCSLEPLIQALEESDNLVHVHILRSLEQFGTACPIAPFIRALTLKNDARAEAARILGNRGDVAAVGSLIGSLEDENYSVRGNVAVALGQLGDARAVQPLIRLLGDKNEYIRNTTADVLSKFGEKPLAEAVVSALSGSPQAVIALDDSRAVEPLIHALHAHESGLRINATDALGQMRDSAVDPLIDTLKSGNFSARYSAATALGVLCDTRAVEPLIKAFSDSDKGVRAAAAGALGEIGDTRAIEPLIAGIKDNDSNFSKQAIDALVQIGTPAVEPLIAALGDKNDSIREAAAETLRQIGDSRSVEPLIAALSDSSYRVRKSATVGLGNIGDARSVEPLIALLKDGVTDVRKAAVSALGQIGDARAVEPIASAIKEMSEYQTDPFVRALGEIGGERAADILLELLNSPHYTICRAAIEALGTLGDKRAEEPLLTILISDIKGLETSLKVEQLASLNALVKFGGKRTVNAIKAAIPHFLSGSSYDALDAALLNLEGTPKTYNIRCWVETISPQQIPAMFPLEATAKVLVRGLEIAFGYVFASPLNALDRSTQIGLFQTISTENTMDPTFIHFRGIESITGNFSSGETIDQLYYDTISPDVIFTINLIFENHKKGTTLKLTIMADSAHGEANPEETLALYNRIVEGSQCYYSLPWE
jgi:HEAT repeat protein